MTPGIALLVIGGILLVSGWKGGSIADAFTGEFPKGPRFPGEVGGNESNGSNANNGGFSSIVPPTTGGKWKVPAGGASTFKGPRSRELDYLAGVAQNKFGLTITATTNGGHVANSFHYRGEAFDAAGPADKMNKFAQFVMENFRSTISELIHNDGASGYAINDGQKVNGASVYSRVWEGHLNHVHVAAGV